MSKHIKQAHPSQLQGLLDGSISLIVHPIHLPEDFTNVDNIEFSCFNRRVSIECDGGLKKYQSNTPCRVGDEIHWQEEYINMYWQSIDKDVTYYKQDPEDVMLAEMSKIPMIWQPASEMPHEFIRIKHRVTAVEVKKLAEACFDDYYEKYEHVKNCPELISSHKEEFKDNWNELNPETPYDPELYCWSIKIERIDNGG